MFQFGYFMIFPNVSPKSLKLHGFPPWVAPFWSPVAPLHCRSRSCPCCRPAPWRRFAPPSWPRRCAVWSRRWRGDWQRLPAVWTPRTSVVPGWPVMILFLNVLVAWNVGNGVSEKMWINPLLLKRTPSPTDKHRDLCSLFAGILY